jgi:hypothetical protein
MSLLQHACSLSGLSSLATSAAAIQYISPFWLALGVFCCCAMSEDEGGGLPGVPANIERGRHIPLAHKELTVIVDPPLQGGKRFKHSTASLYEARH